MDDGFSGAVLFALDVEQSSVVVTAACQPLKQFFVVVFFLGI